MNPQVAVTTTSFTLISSSVQLGLRQRIATAILVTLALTCIFFLPASLQAQTVTATTPAGDSPVAVALNPVTNKMYVANSLSNSVTVIDGATNSVSTIAVGARPQAIAVNPVTNKIYVANHDSNSVTIVDGETNATTNIGSGGGNPSALAVNTVTNRIYVANSATNSVAVIDGDAGAIMTTIGGVGSFPIGIAVNVVTNRIYVANKFSNNVAVILGASNNIISMVGAQTGSSAIAVNPVTNRIYVANYGSATLTVIDGMSNGSTSLGVGATPVAVTVNPVTNKIFVVNSGGNSVAVVDGFSHGVSMVWAGSSPQAVAVNTTTNRVYVANTAGNTMTIIDGTSYATSTIAVGSSPVALAVNPATDKIYVANRGSNNVTVVDAAANTTATIPVGSFPSKVAVNPATRKIYVANQQAASVTVIDATNNSTMTIPTGALPNAVAVNPVTNKIYVANSQGGTVTVIDGATNGTINIPTGSYPFALAVNPVTNKIYVANSWSNTVTVIDGATNGTVTLSAAGRPYSVAVNTATNRIYIANNDSNNVMVLDGATNSTITFVPTGGYPQSIAVNPITNKIYVANVLSPYVTIIDGLTNAAAALPIGVQPTAVAVNTITNKIYTANFHSNSFTTIDGTTYAYSTTNRGGYPGAIAVDEARNKIYISNQSSNDTTVIDGITRTAISVSAGGTPYAVAVDPATGKAYVANMNSSTVTVITPTATQSVPLSVTLAPVIDAATLSSASIFATRDHSPSFTATVNSTFAPNSPAPTALYYQLDSTQGQWLKSTAEYSAGANPASYSMQVPELPLGIHTLYAYAAYGEEAGNSGYLPGGQNSPQISPIAAYTFSIMPTTTTTTIMVDVNPQQYGSSVTFTAAVVPDFPSSVPLTGTVVFSDGATVLGQVALDGSGHAALATSSLAVGTHTITAVYRGNPNYLASNGSVAATLEMATPVITWSDPADVYYGTALSATQLNASASVPGELTYTPAMGTVLRPGSAQVLHVEFTPMDSSNYRTTSLDVHINVLQATVTPSVTASDKVYDGTASATLLTRELTGVVGGDDVTLVVAAASFDSKHVGIDKPVTASGLSLTGANAGDYTLATNAATAAAAITTKTLNVTATGTNRAYDGNATALVNLEDDRVLGDALTFSYTATFADKTVGSAKPITVTGITITGGTDQGNYMLSSTTTSTTADITAAPLHVTATGGTRIYDGTVGATSLVTISDDRVTGDLLTFGFTAAFGDKHAGASKPIAITGLSITGGADQSNYSLAETTAATTGTITPRTLHITVGGGTRTYDGTADASSVVTLSDDRLSGDALTFGFAAAFADSNVGSGKPISVHSITIAGGTDQGNYVLDSNVAATNGSITPAAASVLPNAATKTYGSADPMLTGTLSGFVTSDNVTAVYSRVPGETVGAGPYTISATLSPAAALANYTINSQSSEFTITPAPLTVVANDNSRMFGSQNPALDGILTGVLVGDNITAAYSTAATTTSDPGTYAITPTLQDPGNRLDNYAVTSTPGTLTVTQAPSTTSLTATSQTVLSGSSVSFTATVTVDPAVVPTGSVTFREGKTVLGTVALDGTGKATYSTSQLSPGWHFVTSEYSADARYLGSSSMGIKLAVQDFSLPASPPALTVTAGQSTTATLAVAPMYGFTGSVNFTCAVPAAMSKATCSATAAQITGSGSANSTLTVTTTASRQVLATTRHWHWNSASFGIMFAAFLSLGAQLRSRRRLLAIVLCIILLLVFGALVGCGNGNAQNWRTDPGTPAGTYSVIVTATSGTATHTMNVSVTVQ